MKLSQAALLVALVGCSAAQAATVGVDNSAGGGITRPWLGFMNVFDLSNNFQFASGWGVGDLNASFNDGASTLTLSPNTIGDTNEYWYQGVGTNPGGPGAPGNKLMEANLYQEDNTNVYSGTTLTFAGFVQSNTFTSAHVAKIFVRDFAPDYSSFNESTIAMVPGAFSVSLNTLPGPGRHVQWGFQVKGVNVWTTDTAPFGNAVILTPAPGAAGLMGLAGLIAGRRRRA
jgi:hypothetical protein